MRTRSITLLVLVIGAALFAILNWKSITAPAELNLLLTRVEAPLGLTMLVALSALTGIYLFFLAQSDAQALVEARRQAKEIERLRAAADKAEDSRFVALQELIALEFSRLHKGEEPSPADAAAGSAVGSPES